jgi:hypothetical protein
MDDALGGNGTTAPAAAVKLRTDPMWARGRFDAGVGAAIEADADGDVWLGFGPFGRAALPWEFRVEASVMAGAYSRGDGDDLGSPVEFRSRLGVSRSVGPVWRVRLAFEHNSNGGVAKLNPGVETVFVTLGRRF